MPNGWTWIWYVFNMRSYWLIYLWDWIYVEQGKSIASTKYLRPILFHKWCYWNLIKDMIEPTMTEIQRDYDALIKAADTRISVEKAFEVYRCIIMTSIVYSLFSDCELIGVCHRFLFIRLIFKRISVWLNSILGWTCVNGSSPIASLEILSKSLERNRIPNICSISKSLKYKMDEGWLVAGQPPRRNDIESKWHTLHEPLASVTHSINKQN